MKRTCSTIAVAKWCSVAVFVLLPLLSGQAQSEPPVVGDAGYAIYFNQMRADVLGIDWIDMQDVLSTGTVEMWIQTTDKHQSAMSTFSYTELLPETDDFYFNEASLQVRLREDRVDVEFGSKDKCKASGCLDFITAAASWTHVALSWNSTSGSYQFFVNGTKAHEKTVDNALWRQPLVPNGCTVFGHDQDEFCSGFSENQAFVGILDEYRVWTTVRTEQEILQYMGTSFSALPSQERAKLNTYYAFDERESTVPDLSGHGNNGLMGRLPGLHPLMVYATSRKATAPTSPAYVASTAPVRGAATPIIVFASVNGADDEILLSAHDEDGDALTVRVVAVPSKGTLHLIGNPTGPALGIGSEIVDGANFQSKRVIYRPVAIMDASGDSFSFDVSDLSTTVEGSVHIWSGSLPDPPAVELNVDEDTMGTLVLGSVGPDGEKLLVEIMSLPHEGNLYQASFPAGRLYSNLDIDEALDITVENTYLSSERGIALFRSETNDFSSSQFSYRWVHPSTGTSSRTANVSIIVAPTNDAPFRTPDTFSVLVDGDAVSEDENFGLQISLSSSDIDGPGTSRYSTISTFPDHANLFQVAETASTIASVLGASQLEATEAPPEVSVWVSKAWNASSQYDYCEHNQPWTPHPDPTCNIFLYNLINVEGEPDVYPEYQDSGSAWVPDASGRGFEFIEVEMATALYARVVDIFETYTPGSVVAVKAAEHYSGASTSWATLWEGETSAAGLVAARIFSPPVCPLPVLAKFLRIELDTASVSGWNELDAIRVKGTMSLPHGKLTNVENKVWFNPKKGVHSVDGATFDTFAYTASDCVDSGDPITVSVTMTPPTLPHWKLSAFSNRTIIAVAGSTDSVRFNMSLELQDVARAHLGISDIASRLDEISNFTESRVQVMVKGSNPDLSSNGSFIVSHFGDDHPLHEEWAFASDYTFELSLSEDQVSTAFVVWVIADDTHVYRIQYDLEVECAFGLVKVGDDSACAPCDTVDDQTYLSFDTHTKVAFSENCQRTFVRSQGLLATVVSSTAICFITIAVIFAGFLFFGSHWIMKLSSFRFCLCIFVGALGMLAYVAMLSLTPTPFVCGVSPWLIHISFVLAIGSLCSKTHRIAAIFVQGTSLEVVQITDKEVMNMVLKMVAAMSALLLLWTLIDPSTPVTIDGLNYSMTVCASKSKVWSYLALLGDAALLAWGLYLCFKVRNTPGEANESKHIAMGIYAISLVTILVLPVTLLTSDPDILYALVSMAILASTTTLIAALFLPKFYMIKYPEATTNSLKSAVSATHKRHQSGKQSLHSRQPSRAITTTAAVAAAKNTSNVIRQPSGVSTHNMSKQSSIKL